MAYLTTRPVRPLFSSVPSLRNEMNRLFDDFFPQAENLERLTWMPPLDVSEKDDQVKVIAELPGVDPKDVKVELTGNVLSIRGEKKSEKESKGDSWLQVERSFGSFQRSIVLPDGVDAEKVKASAHDGVLTIEIAKTEAVRPRSISVKTT